MVVHEKNGESKARYTVAKKGWGERSRVFGIREQDGSIQKDGTSKKRPRCLMEKTDGSS